MLFAAIHLFLMPEMKVTPSGTNKQQQDDDESHHNLK